MYRTYCQKQKDKTARTVTVKVAPVGESVRELSFASLEKVFALQDHHNNNCTSSFKEKGRERDRDRVNMGRQGYVGTGEDVQRIARQQKEREEERKKFDEARSRAEKAGTSSSGTGLNFKQFGAGSTEALERNFRNETVGLVTREEFAEKRATLQERYEEEEKERKRAASEQALKDRRRKRSELKAKASKLSFAEEEDEEEEGGDDEFAGDLFQNPFKKNKKFSNFGKNPDAETSFLPDKDRELEQEKRRDELREEFLKEEELAKKKPLKIVYSYWNGSGNRKETTVMQGDTGKIGIGRDDTR